MAMTSESHTSNDRAGFSVTMLGNDGSGIELGFWANEVWAQNANPMFTHGEGVSIDTTIARNYRLQVQGNNYALLSGADTLLAGSVRDYRSSGLVPYNLPNFLFLGITLRGCQQRVARPYHIGKQSERRSRAFYFDSIVFPASSLFCPSVHAPNPTPEGHLLAHRLEGKVFEDFEMPNRCCEERANGSR